jgi:heme O synthase-like polyprenyltransferase
MHGVAAIIYAVLASAMGVGYAYLASRVIITRERRDARRAFIASVIHLPVLMAAMVLFAVVSRLL